MRAGQPAHDWPALFHSTAVTKALLRTEETTAATTAAAIRATTQRRLPIEKAWPAMRRRTTRLPTSPWARLLIRQPMMIASGTPLCQAAAKCAAMAAATNGPQRCGGATSKAPNSTAPGTHSTEAGLMTVVRARPRQAPP